MSVFLLPMNTCKSLESVMSSYWWKSSKQSRGVSWMSWKKLCKHKSTGGLGFKDLREYNLPLLGKQAWRLLVNDTTLVSKVFKARYFPKGSFLTSSLRNNPSYVWKSIFETKQLILAGARKSIAKGFETSILEDPWLPDATDPFVRTSHPGLVNHKVSSLICIDRHQWDKEILDDMFDDRDLNLIISILLPLTVQKDGWTWSKEKTGVYLVKSAYRWLQNHDISAGLDSNFWIAFWKINLQPKSLAFWSCWHRSSVNIIPSSHQSFHKWFQDVMKDNNPTQIEEALMVTWAIWNARNKLLWNQKRKEAEHWTKPGANMVKINVDGAIFEAHNSFGFAIIARARSGCIIEALSWIKTKGWTFTIFETDCLMAVQAIHNNCFIPSTFGMLVHDCQNLLSELSNVTLSFVKCSANKAAHFLARSSSSLSDCTFDARNLPSELVNIVMIDLNY
ncbi:hypothetical protein CsatB_000940 [Cannabis sativa]